MKNLTVMLGRTFVVAMFVVATPAAAEEPKLTPAEVLIKAGKDSSDAGQWVDAAKFFDQSYAIEPLPRTAALLGRAQIMAGNELVGAANLELFLREEKQFPPGLKEAALELLARAKLKIVTVTLQVNQPGAELFVDGTRIEDKRSSWPLYLPVGEHSFEAKKAGFVPANFRGGFVAGEAVKVPMVLSPIGSGSRDDESKGMNPRQVTAYAVGGGLLLGAIGTGIYAGVTYGPTLKSRTAYEVANRELCDPLCLKHYNAYRNGAARLQGLTITTAVLAAAGLGTLGFAALNKWSAATPPQTGRVSWVVVPSLGGMVVQGSW